jgi:hypothetical protein
MLWCWKEKNFVRNYAADCCLAHFSSFFAESGILILYIRMKEDGQVPGARDDRRGVVWQSVQGHMPSHREPCRSEAHSQGELVLFIYMRYQAHTGYIYAGKWSHWNIFFLLADVIPQYRREKSKRPFSITFHPLNFSHKLFGTFLFQNQHQIF